MTPSTFAVLVTVLLALASVVGDYFLKVASQAASPVFNPHFAAGFAVYAATAFGWVYVMPHIKLAHIGVIFSLTVVLSLCLVAVVLFKEELSATEWVGIALAIVSLLLLQRVA